MAKNQLLKTFVVVAATMLFLFSVTRLLIYCCCVGLVAVWLCYFFFIFVWFVCSFNFGFSIELKNERTTTTQTDFYYLRCAYIYSLKSQMHTRFVLFLILSYFFETFLTNLFFLFSISIFFLWRFSTVLKRQFFCNTFGSKFKFEKFLQLYHETEAI